MNRFTVRYGDRVLHDRLDPSFWETVVAGCVLAALLFIVVAMWVVILIGCVIRLLWRAIPYVIIAALLIALYATIFH